MDSTDFLKQQQRAVEQMKEMNSRSTKNEAVPKINPPKIQNNAPLPFLNFLKDKDTTLILGLLLILYSENADKMLLFALIYILL